MCLVCIRFTKYQRQNAAVSISKMASQLLGLILFTSLFIYMITHNGKTESGYQLKVDRSEIEYDYLENDLKFLNAHNGMKYSEFMFRFKLKFVLN